MTGFTNWLNAVDQHLEATVGLDHRDLADQPYHDWYTDGVKPATAAKRALRSEGFA